jgi:ketosteroid isomerase-like protein
MKKQSILVVITILFFMSMSFAQTKDEKEVADAVEQLKMAMLNADKAALENLAADKLSYGHSGGAIDDKKSFVDKLVSGASDFVTIDLSEQTISVSNKTAIVRHILKAKTNDGGKPGEANIRVLLVWEKQKGGWKLLARQAVRMS